MSRQKSKRLLLFITRIPPELGGGGAHVYSYDVLAALAARGFDVHVLLLEPCLLRGRLPWVVAQDPGSAFRRLCPGYVKIGNKFWHPKGVLYSIRNKLSRWFKFMSAPPLAAASWGNELTKEEAAWVRLARDRQKWDVVICNLCWLAGALSLFDSKVCKAILTQDVWHKHITRKSDNPFFQVLDSEKEKAYLNSADIIIAITETDAADFRALLPQKKIVCAPMSCSPSFSLQPATPGRLLFVGSDYQPNVDGMIWFLNEVGPILERKAPGRFRLNLVGSVCKALPVCQRSISLVMKGRVENLASEYVNAEIVIVPILSGTGLKIKLVEAMSHGKAIVTTTSGAQGVEHLYGKAFYRADTADDFAEGLIAISFDNKRRADFEAGARSAALEIFSQEACYAQLVGVLQSAD